MAEQELKSLKARRGAVKGKLTRFKNYFDKIDKDDVSKKLITDVEFRLSKVLPLYEEFHVIQEKIDELEVSKDNENEINTFEASYFELVSDMQTFCDNFKIEYNADMVSVHSDSNKEVNNSFQALVKLPPISLCTFNGHYDSWLEYKDCFLALVHNNASLTDIQRFYYLRSSLEAGPQQIIKSIKVSSINYKIAWQMLTERYENKKLIIHNHLKAIFDHPAINNESHLELRDLFDNVTKHLRSLNSLGLDTQSWDSIIIFIMCSKFDATTRRDWECFKHKNDLPSMTDLNIFLKEKCQMLEKLQISSGYKNNKAKVRNVNSRSFASIERQSSVKCYFCQNDHPIYKCDAFLKLNINDRISAAKRLNLCLNCLKNSHPTWKCKLQKCIKCHKVHNSLLHLNNPNANVPRNMVTTDINDPNQHRTGSNPNIDIIDNCIERSDNDQRQLSSSLHISKDVANSYEISEVLLSTVLVRIVNGNKSIVCRGLLDSGSQSSFISEKICKLLDLKCQKVEHLVKGVGEVLAKINKEAIVTISSSQGNFIMDTHCLVIPNITGKLPIRKTGVLTPEEIEAALALAINSVQRECFPLEYKRLMNNKEIPNKSKIIL
ncbi:uncharacterized protein LOC126890179 [Diabrotica virgifera virgifera]|uniref:Peptidase aspartic putative domain-containing protein n=1 Tax=Diabrotica virgifera virgifera TaxID=50390 RepID=A0ABM5KXR8_DIAVI|nr:uncharacterized protein LOC126890179 [Diabrotica virgifera virgifera]